MKHTTSKLEKVLGIISAIILIVVPSYSIYLRVKLKEEPEYTEATIYRFYYRKGHKASYEFFINGERFQGSGGYHPDKDLLKIGDRCRIIFQRKDPSNNKLYKDENKRVIRLINN